MYRDNMEVCHCGSKKYSSNINPMLRKEFSELSIFHGLNPEQLDQLASLIELYRFSKDDVIFGQGQATDFLYILLSGEVEIRYKPYDGPILSVARIFIGGVFGWSAVVGHESYTSMAIAARDGEAYRMSGQELKDFCSGNPTTGVIILEHLAGAIAERLQSTHAQILTILGQSMDVEDQCLQRIEQNGK
ncbi:MAG: Crp/Fnr family transcriptional regulator [Anaerolineaceae bacterium]